MATVGLPEMKKFKYADELAAGSVASGGGTWHDYATFRCPYRLWNLNRTVHRKTFCSWDLSSSSGYRTFYYGHRLSGAIFYPEQGPKGEKYSLKEKLVSLGGMGETLTVFALVMADYSGGLFTPTEAAAIGVLGVLAVALIRRQLNWSQFVIALYDTLKTSCMVMMLVGGATIFGKFLAVTRIPYDIASWIGGFDLPPLLILGMVVIVYFIGGCFMDSLALVMLTVPIFFSTYHATWF